MIRILLTGSKSGPRKGFIGSRFAKKYGDQYEIVEYTADIRNAEGIIVSDFDFVIHLAALAGVRRSHEIPQEYWKTNVEASKYIFEACEKANVPIIYASSSSVYEWWLSPYAATKYAMEAIAPKNSIGLRFHTVYGPDSREDMLYDALLRKDPKLTYLTNHTRDWTHVDDVCNAIDICITYFDMIVHNKAIDVGNGKPVTVKEMADKVWPENNLPLKEVTGERQDTCADPTILTKFGWVANHHVLEDDYKTQTMKQLDLNWDGNK